MQPDVADLSQLSQIISHATAPAFLLGAVAGFVSILTTRMNRVIDQLRDLTMSVDDDPAEARRKASIPLLRRRAQLLNHALRLALASGICTTLLVALAFASAFVGLRHEQMVGILFILALGLLAASLFAFTREVWLGLHEVDQDR
jgi:hypothetical protein